MEKIRSLEIKNVFFDWNKDAEITGGRNIGKGHIFGSTHNQGGTHTQGAAHRQSQTSYLLKGLQINLKESERVGILGATGVGKSTLAQILSARVEAKSAKYYLNENRVSFQEFRTSIRLQCQLLPQIPTLGFNPMLRIQQSMYDVLPLYQKKLGFKKQDAQYNFKKDLQNLCSVFDINGALLQQFPSQLSGGQLQRFSIVRSLVSKPKLLILDEPVSFLDLPLQKRILDTILSFQNMYKTTIIIITHLQKVHEYFSQRMYSLVDGKLQSK